MSNTFLTAKEIARAALPILSNNTVLPMLVHTDYSTDFSKKGDTIQVRKPSVFTAIEFDGDLTGEYQAITETEVDVKLDKIADVSVEVTSKELTLNVEDFNAQVVEPAMVALAQKIDLDLAGLYIDIPYFVGTSGVTPDALEDIANVNKKLNMNKTPNDTNRRLVFDEEAEAKFLALDSIVDASQSGSVSALRDASLGKIYKMGLYMDQNIVTHVAGGYTSLADVSITAGAAGATSIVLTSTAGAAITALAKGDLFTLDGNQYVVTAASANAIAGVVTAAIYPALPKAFGAMTTKTVAFADVTARAHTANLGFHRSAFALVNRPQMSPMGGADSYSTTANGTINVRVTMGYDMNTKANKISFDVLYGIKTLYPQLATILLG